MISSRPLPPLLAKILFSPSDTKQVVRAHTYFRAHIHTIYIHLGLIIESSPAGAALFRIDLVPAAVRRFLFLARARAGVRERGNT
jgi:hypothetical protein